MSDPSDHKRKDPKEIVRAGYDRISEVYRAEDFDYANSNYRTCLEQLVPRLEPEARLLDLGCGCGVPVSQVLAERCEVTGVDFSPVQIERAKRLVPGARFLCADMTAVEFEPGAFDAIVSFFAIIHVPVVEQPSLFRRLASWLRPGGLLLVSAGYTAWTGTEPDWKGAEMYWSHAGAATYREWLANLGFHILWEMFIPEGESGHPVFLAQKKVPKERSLDSLTRTHLDNIRSEDRELQNQAFSYLLEATAKPVDWAYEAWADLLEGLSHKDNHVRAIAAQVLCNLAKSDPQKRMLEDFDALLAITKDERFVTARHCLQSLWKVGAAGEAQQQRLIEGLEGRFRECITEKNCTLIRYDIIQDLRNLYDEVGDESIREKALELIEAEEDLKYRKKYAGVWRAK